MYVLTQSACHGTKVTEPCFSKRSPPPPPPPPRQCLQPEMSEAFPSLSDCKKKKKTHTHYDVIKGCCFVANSSMQTIMFLNTVGTYCALRCVGRPQCCAVNDTGWFMLIPTYCSLLVTEDIYCLTKKQPPVPEMLSFSNIGSISPCWMYCMCVNNAYNYHCGA